jgi:hypothetical protein
MGKQPKPYESPLALVLAEEILLLFQEVEPVEQGTPRTIADLVRRSAELIDRTNERLASSQVVQIVARSIMQDLKKRGDASIAIRHDGTMILRVTYGEEVERPNARARRDAPSVQTTHRSDLPYLDDLREEAAELGADISHLGRQRRAIQEYLQAYKANLKPGVDEVRVMPVVEGVVAPPKGRRPTLDNGPGRSAKAPEEAGAIDIDDLLGLPTEDTR